MVINIVFDVVGVLTCTLSFAYYILYGALRLLAYSHVVHWWFLKDGFPVFELFHQATSQKNFTSNFVSVH